MNRLLSIPKWLLSLPIRFYKRCISPLLPDSCRFTPTCSAYAIEAISEYGALRGFFKGFYRVLRCNPFNKNSGFDPVKNNLKGEIKWSL